MEFIIDNYNEISFENYKIFHSFLQDPTFPNDFKYQIITLMKDHSSKAQIPPISQMIESNMVPLLMDLKNFIPLDEKNTLNILWIITNILTGTKSDIDHVIANKGIEFLLSYIPNDNKEIVHQSVWGLSNIAGESPYYRDLIISYGVLEKIIFFFQDENDLLILKTLVWFICNISRGHPFVNYQLIKPSIIYLQHLLQFCGEFDILLDFLWSLSYITEINSDAIHDIISSNIIPILANSYLNIILSNHQLLSPFLRILANMVAGDEFSTWFVINLGILNNLVELFDNSNANIRKEVAFLFSNIAAGTCEQISSLLSLDLFFEKIKKILMVDEHKVKKECIWILSNLLSSNYLPVAVKMIETDVMKYLLHIFPEFLNDNSLEKNLLVSYKNYLEFLQQTGNIEAFLKYKVDLTEFVEKYSDSLIEVDEMENIVELLKNNLDGENYKEDVNIADKFNDLRMED